MEMIDVMFTYVNLFEKQSDTVPNYNNYMQNGSQNIVVDDVAVKFITQDSIQALYLTSVPPYSRHTLSDIKLLFRWQCFCG